MDKVLEKKRKSSGKKDFERRLAQLNCKRGACMALAVSALLAGLWFINEAEGAQPYWYSAMTIVAVTMELSAAVLLFYIVHNMQGAMTAAYRVYYFLTAAVLMAFCIVDYWMNGSMLLYVLIMGAAVCVPVVKRSEMNAYSGIMLAVCIIGCCMAASDGVRNIFQFVCVGILGIFAGRYSQERYRSCERTRDGHRELGIVSDEDALTGLSNRRGLLNTANVLWPFCVQNNSAVGAISIDVDNFKKYNDRFGHTEGDECLKKIASAIEGCACGQTDKVARMGGEEFLVLVQGVEKDEMIELALRIRSAIAELKLEQAYAGTSRYVTVSMGIAYTCPDASDSFKKLYDDASEALYTAKENGRNCVVCDGLIYGRMRNGMGTVIGE